MQESRIVIKPEVMTLAPIALFVYNRPSHTRRTVEALKQNDLAGDSDLFVFSDAPKSAAQADAVREVRDHIRKISGFKSVTVVERDTNLGLARSIIEGVTELCEKFGRVVVLEDDLVTSPHFLRFMNDALELYKDEEQVMHISGSLYPIEAMRDETFFFRVPLCWGWATWDRAWRHFYKSNEVMTEFNQKMRRDFSVNGTYHFWKQLEDNNKGLINTWFVYWYAALFLRGAMALFPGRSLVMNIGMDGSGVHSGINDIYGIAPSDIAINVLPMPVRESGEAVIKHENYFRKEYPPPPPILIRVVRKALRLAGKLFRGVRSEGVQTK